MRPTSITLLDNARNGSREAWEGLDAIYRPFLAAWLRRRGVPQVDAEDLAQDVLITVARELPSFQHNGRSGAFRNWVRQMTVHRVQAYWRTCARRGRPVGGTEFQQQLQRQADDKADMDADWDRDHDQHVVRHLLQRAGTTFESATIDAFRLVAIDAVPAVEVAARLGISATAVYIAKSRVLRWLRTHATGLVDNNWLS